MGFKLISFCTPKETTDKRKRQPTEWEKVFANYVANKGLVSKIYKQFMRLNTIKTKINKWDLIKLKSFLHSRGKHKQNEKTTHRMGENICK